MQVKSKDLGVRGVLLIVCWEFKGKKSRKKMVSWTNGVKAKNGDIFQRCFKFISTASYYKSIWRFFRTDQNNTNKNKAIEMHSSGQRRLKATTETHTTEQRRQEKEKEESNLLENGMRVEDVLSIKLSLRSPSPPLTLHLFFVISSPSLLHLSHV